MLNIGDVVLLKSDLEPLKDWQMTVQTPEFTREIRVPSFTGDTKQVLSFVSCAWHDATGVLQSSEFLVDTLEKVHSA